MIAGVVTTGVIVVVRHHHHIIIIVSYSDLGSHMGMNIELVKMEGIKLSKY